MAGEAGLVPIEIRLRANVLTTIEAVFEEGPASFLSPLRYCRVDGVAKGYRHGHRGRQRTGRYSTETMQVPRARIENQDGEMMEWRSKVLPR
ncbi:hypothetical protein EKE94_10715 [Mesobaculum littorinae]|uniref:Uncharacterized protein n=1 Tax=Mesobaculum littorinae TaxID=2486419 RepID=A0A438AGW8_9RHOB|nr:hypothetical protein EKE94_10715 [Mesobaculum littorinae]